MGDVTVFAAMVESLFTMAKLSVEVMLLLFGTLTLWLGFYASQNAPVWCALWPVCYHLCLRVYCLVCLQGTLL